MVEVEVCVIGPEYKLEPLFGVVPSVVYLMVAPDVAVVIVTVAEPV